MALNSILPWQKISSGDGVHVDYIQRPECTLYLVSVRILYWVLFVTDFVYIYDRYGGLAIFV